MRVHPSPGVKQLVTIHVETVYTFRVAAAAAEKLQTSEAKSEKRE